MGDPNPQPNMPGSQPSLGNEPAPDMPSTGVDTSESDDDDELPETPVVVIEDTALPGI